MGILPYNSLSNSNSIYNSPDDLNRQLATRRAQLQELNARPTLSDQDQSKKQQLERIVARMSQNGTPQKDGSYPSKKYPEGTVVMKSSPAQQASGMAKSAPSQQVPDVAKSASSQQVPGMAKSASSQQIPDSYLKGFFFDAQI